jgi:hypothetical protein
MVIPGRDESSARGALFRRAVMQDPHYYQCSTRIGTNARAAPRSDM